MATQYAKDQAPGFVNAIKNVALVGATGQIGKVFTEHLLKSGKQTVTALTRRGSKTTVPEGVKLVHVDYDDEVSLVEALKGQDFLVITLALTAPPDTHSKLVRAAGKAGVSYIVPNAYGVDFYGHPKFQDDIEALNLGVGPFTYGFDFPNKKVTFYDEGKTRANTTTWPQTGRALAALVNMKKLPQDENDTSTTLAHFANKPVYIKSFTVNQRELLDNVNKVLGQTDKDWSFSYQPAAERFREGLDELSNGLGTGFLKALYSRAFYPTGEGVFETHNDLLGLPEESLDEATLAAHNWAIAQAGKKGE
ncbi:oxidoreductase like [Fusarium denticulatum]|uniref:Oxidoreductase like n=1 Tax=Fusarium denticulatum TaxID=48507 RepID=A0A8H5TLW5_9HYPO|nr:oxidoreductase like [Fusarium denticulatum]